MYTKIFTLLSLALLLGVPLGVSAGSSFTHSNTITVDYNPSASISATPQTIYEGESTYVRFYTMPGISNCRTDFPYDPIDTSIVDLGNGYWSMEVGGGGLTDYPASTRTYNVTCDAFVQQDQANNVTYRPTSASVTVTVLPRLEASCEASPAVAGLNDVVTWTATPPAVSGGAPSFAYSWSGTDSLQGTSASIQKSYVTTGTKNATVTVTSGSDVWTAACSAAVAYACGDERDNDGDGFVDMADGGCDGSGDNDENDFAASISANPTQVPVGASSTLTWSCAGGATSASIAGIGAVSPASGGSVSTGALSQSTNNFELTCTKGGQTDTDIAVVTTRTPTGDIEARDERVLDGGSTLITWACDALSTSGSATAPNGFSQNTVSGTNAPSGTITTQTVFTLSCDGVVVDSEIVNTTVSVDEF